MEQFKKFDAEKATAVNALEDLRAILHQLDGIGVDVNSDLEKVASALETVESDVLRVALLGAYSDGKTSVIAAWLVEVMDDMKIDMDESSDRLEVYRPEGLPDKCEIIDTPGLFGDKRKEIDGEQVMYEDVTKRYISEAHLVFYVVDATNPLKESHNEIAKWVLRDLDKMDSTIFVINKMDEVTDLTEETLFEEQSAIKKESLKVKVQHACNLDSEELDRLNIVTMASNPGGRGLEFWFSKPESYESRSRINKLKEATNEVLRQNVSEKLIAKTGIDVVRDLVNKRVNDARDQFDQLEVFACQREQESKRIREDVESGRKEVKQLSAELLRELQGMEKRLLGELRPVSLEELKPFMEDYVGLKNDEVGYKLQGDIKATVGTYFEKASVVTNRISKDIESQLDSSESFLDNMSGSAFKAVGKGVSGLSRVNPATIKSAIFGARDVLAKTTGYVFKFKPWQATNIAASVSKWSGPAGVVINLGTEAYSAYKERERELQLNEAKEEIGDMIKGAFKDVYDILNDDVKVMELFAPQIKEFESMVAEMEEVSRDIRTNQETLRQIEGSLEQLALPGECVDLTSS